MSVFMERLQGLMDERNINDRELKEACQISQNSITNWRKGMKPQTAMVDKLAAYFNVSRDYLLGIDDIKKDMLAVLDPPEDDEQKLLYFYRKCDKTGQFRIIQVVMNEYDRSRKEIL